MFRVGANFCLRTLDKLRTDHFLQRIPMTHNAFHPHTKATLADVEHRLRRLSPERLQVLSDFLGYLEEREEIEATEELLSIPGFQDELNEARQQVETGDVVAFGEIRRDV